MIKLKIHSNMQKKVSSCLQNVFFRFCTGPLKTLNQSKYAGKLTILPTPIGNLQDLSPNVLKALFKADVIGCEDRRVAGKLYTLIKSRNIMESVVEDFGEIGLKGLIPILNQQNQQKSLQQQNYLFYDYANMNQKARKKFIRKMTKEEQQKFKIDFLKYRALKIMQKQDDIFNKQKQDKYDELYGIDSSDLQHIELQIRNTRMKKGRGILIPLNTYSETKMFDMVKMFLQNKNVAIISDAGMPCISDPGWKMVRKIRQSLPQLPIEVIGGPSSVSLMTLIASLSLQNGKSSLSGRFEGFAPQQISHMDQKSIQIQTAKKKQFSIHFINSKKLRKKALEMQKIYDPDQKILLANELTKLYERKYHGTLGQLNSEMSKQDSQFHGIGQLSYLIYPKDKPILEEHKIVNKINSQLTQQKNQQDSIPNLPRLSLISLQNFINSIKKSELQLLAKTQQSKPIQQSNEPLEKTKKTVKGNGSQISSKDIIDLVCSVFGTKASEARKFVYQKQISLKKQRFGQKQNPFDPKKVYESQIGQTSQQNKGKRLGRRTSRKKQQKISPEQLQFLKLLQTKNTNFL